jgi:hypothetical protein
VAELPGYFEGHLIVAAVRVLEAQLRRPPNEEEIAGLLGWPPERVGLVTRGLEAAGVVRPVVHAFDARLEIVDHLGLEKLPRGDVKSSIASEMEEFGKRVQEEQEQIQRLFESGEADRQAKERIESLDKEFGRFQKKRPRNPFDES